MHGTEVLRSRLVPGQGGELAALERDVDLGRSAAVGDARDRLVELGRKFRRIHELLKRQVAVYAAGNAFGTEFIAVGQYDAGDAAVLGEEF